MGMTARKVTDDEIREAAAKGGRTHHIAKRLGIADTGYVLRRLSKLQARGEVFRDDRYTFANSIYWAAHTGPVQVEEIREFVLDWLPSDAAGDDFKARLICKLDLLNTTERR